MHTKGKILALRSKISETIAFISGAVQSMGLDKQIYIHHYSTMVTMVTVSLS
jgi:hypothetical protein